MKLFKGKDYYKCRHCGYVLRKEDAIVSGYDSQSSLRHVYCPRCGKIITYFTASQCRNWFKVSMLLRNRKIGKILLTM